MKDFVCLVAAAVCLCSCERLEHEYAFLPLRSDVYGRSCGQSFPGRRAISGDGPLLVSAVDFPKDYDWRRDTAIGIASGCRIVVYRDMVRQFAFNAGYSERVSTDPDTHHFVDGRFYTEFSSADSTYIKRDGLDIAAYSGREMLLGLLERGGHLHTLGMDRGGRGFTYRIDGAVMLSVPSGTPFGSFEDCAYPRSGAIYTSDGSVCFSYRALSNGIRSVHVVTDGIDSPLDLSLFTQDPDDVRVIGGKVCALVPKSYGCILHEGTSSRNIDIMYQMKDIRLVDLGTEGIGVLGSGRYYMSAEWHFLAVKDGNVLLDMKDGERFVIWNSEAGPFPVGTGEEDSHIFSRGCYDYHDGELYVACTPANPSLPPFVRCGDSVCTLDGLNGYVTGVCLDVSPPS